MALNRQRWGFGVCVCMCFRGGGGLGELRCLAECASMDMPAGITNLGKGFGS
jgi:hypothetical protein